MLSTLSAIGLFLFVQPLMACSLAMCLGGGPELQANIKIKLIHEGKPLPGVNVSIFKNSVDGAIVFSSNTLRDGGVQVSALAPGEYWLNAEYLGISAAYHCFHVASRPSWRAKHRLKYEWGNSPTEIRRLAGRLADSQPGTGRNPLRNLINPVTIPIAGAEVILQNPKTGEVMNTVSNKEGLFAFDEAPATTYVLRIAGGTGQSYEPTSLVVKLTSQALIEKLQLLRQEGCGSPSLQIVQDPR